MGLSYDASRFPAGTVLTSAAGLTIPRPLNTIVFDAGKLYYSTDESTPAYTQIAGSGSTDLQGAYDAGREIDIDPARPLYFYNSTGNSAFNIGDGAHQLDVTYSLFGGDFDVTALQSDWLLSGSGNGLTVIVGTSAVSYSSALVVSPTSFFVQFVGGAFSGTSLYADLSGIAIVDKAYLFTPSPAVTLDVLGSSAFRLGAAISVSTQLATNVAIDASGPVTFAPISSSVADGGVTGFTGGANGRVLVLYNSGVNPIIYWDDVGSTAANRIYTSTRVATVSHLPGQIVHFRYNSTLSRWVMEDPYAGTQKYYATTTLDGTTILQYTTFLLSAGVTLPSLNSSATGREIRIVNTDLANPITITPPGSGIARTISPGGVGLWIWNNPTWYGTG